MLEPRPGWLFLDCWSSEIEEAPDRRFPRLYLYPRCSMGINPTGKAGGGFPSRTRLPRMLEDKLVNVALAVLGYALRVDDGSTPQFGLAPLNPQSRPLTSGQHSMSEIGCAENLGNIKTLSIDRVPGGSHIAGYWCSDGRNRCSRLPIHHLPRPLKFLSIEEDHREISILVVFISGRPWKSKTECVHRRRRRRGERAPHLVEMSVAMASRNHADAEQGKNESGFHWVIPLAI